MELFIGIDREGELIQRERERERERESFIKINEKEKWVHKERERERESCIRINERTHA